MPANERRVTTADIVPTAEFARQRRERRQALLPMKRLRRIELGPYCTFYFECFDTMLFQIQEMLLIEKGGTEQLADEIAAYNPLIPQGSDLVATVMFEIDDERRRAAVLGRLGGVEERFFLQIGPDRVYAEREGDIERTREDGKTSSVHFLHFRVSDAHKGVFRDPRTTIMVGCDHELYAHLAILSPATRAELARDFA